MRGIYTIVLLLISNVFMTLAWYGHISFKPMADIKNGNLILFIFFSWGIALFEYVFMIPANRLGYIDEGGPFNLFQLKTIQEAVSLFVFVLMNIYVFKGDKLQWNHILGFALMILAVFVIFKKWD